MLTWREIDEAPEGTPAFELLAKQPRLRVKTKGPGAFVGNVRYCIIPIRALWLLERVDAVERCEPWKRPARGDGAGIDLLALGHASLALRV